METIFIIIFAIIPSSFILIVGYLESIQDVICNIRSWCEKRRLDRQIKELEFEMSESFGEHKKDLQLMIWLCERARDMI